MSFETTRSNTESMGATELTLAMLISGSVGIFALESHTSSFNVVFFRCVFGAVALGLYCAVRGYYRNSGFTRDRILLAAMGGVFIVFNWAFLFRSFQLTSISVGTVVYHTQPLYVLLLGSVIFRERLTANKIGWLVVAFVGLVLATGLTPSSFDNANRAYLHGIGYALLAAVFYAFATLIAKMLKGVRPHLIALVQVVVGIPLLLPFTDLGSTTGLGGRWGWLVGLGIFHTCIQYALMYSSYQKLPTSKIAVLSFVYPAVAMVLDFVVYGHHVSVSQALGIPFIVLAGLGVNLGWNVLPARRGQATETEITVVTSDDSAHVAVGKETG
jgi:Permeases of the drug/metabolite transporter (DMT) superfamily